MRQKTISQERRPHSLMATPSESPFRQKSCVDPPCQVDHGKWGA